jgi:xanthine dehydrogenase accessory factor
MAKSASASGEPVVVVRVAEARGSAPRGVDAMMLVSQSAFAGTIGGGQLEYLALARAREMLAGGERHGELDIPLGPQIGQCCGGHVRLTFEAVGRTDLAALCSALSAARKTRPQVLIFGAGHTGRALARAMLALPYAPLLVDSREAAINDLEKDIPAALLAVPEETVRNARPGSAFVVMTHSHDLDFLIVAEALSRPDAAYAGMIGSATKRAVFAKWCASQGYAPNLAERLVCPIGGTAVRDKRPEIIAALAAAEIIAALAAYPAMAKAWG